MNEADEAKVEKERFCLETRLGWFGRRGARCALSCESLFGVALWILFIAHLSAFLSYDMGSCLHTTYIIRVVKYWGLAVATHCIGMAPLTCTCTYCQDSIL